MEEEKAAAYYDELTRKGEGAARFKQGLGFSTNSQSAAATPPPSRGSALVSSTSFLSNFVKASSPTESLNFEKHASLESIQNKLKKKPKDQASGKSRSRESRHRHRSRSRSRERDKERSYTKRSGSGESRDRSYRRRSRSRSRERNYRRRSRSRSRERRRSVSPRRDRRSERRSWSQSLSPREQRRSEKRSGDAKREGARKERNRVVDYSRLIEGYEEMTPADRVKARMKLQLNETAAKDEEMGSGWERFDFDKDAPLDDEEIEAADDDAALVKHIGQSFRFSAVEARREEQIKAAHDEAMFGAPSLPASSSPDNEVKVENNENDGKDTELASGLLSEKVLAKQQGSWRDRARKA